MAKWGYDATNGPAKWATEFPDARGERQSPINIVTSKAQYDPTFTDNPLQIKYSPEHSMCIGNTGASVKADCEQESTITGGPLGKNVYKLIQFHLHWGSDDTKGAEHTIDGKVYSAELHLVHWNSTAYKSFAEAVDKSDGLAVLCMFIKAGNKPHEGFDVVSKSLCNTQCAGSSCKLSMDFDPTCLLPEDTKRYWTYPGSLTTPPCYESVQFILFEKPLEFSGEQMQALRSMKFGGEDSQCMADNYRPTVYIGTRQVQASFVKSQ